jgi:uncharacterized repeat protein (TIGR01451 family)
MFLNKSVRIIFPFVIVLTSIVLILQLESVAPDSTTRDQPARQVFAPPDGLSPSLVASTGSPDIVIYAPVQPASVDLANLPPYKSTGDSKYERWLRGEWDPDEREFLIDPAEMDRLKEEALKMGPSGNVQQMIAGPGRLSPVLGTNFDSLDVGDCCPSGATVPPDPEMSAGPNHLIAVVNVAFEIYDTSGTSLAGPVTFDSFFSPLGGTNCTAGGPFDPNTLYDEENDRFMMAVDGDGKAYCVAVSQTSDPTGSWWLYEFPTNVSGRFFDYPHAGIGRDAIYLGANMFSGSFVEGRVWALDKSAMYAGNPASSVSRTTGNDGTPQPVNLHGFAQGTWPVSGPHYILTDGNFDGATYRLYSWDDPFGTNNWSLEANLNLPAYHGVSVGFPIDSVQAGTGGTITANDFRVLDFEFSNGSGWTAMTVSCNPGGGTVNCVQWAEIDLAGASLVQAGVFASPGDYRYFPDIAADQCGNATVGYTKSSFAIFPSVWTTGRVSGDPLGTMQPEVEVKGGEVTYTAFADRWGDYTGMTIAPDGLTFWYLGEYSKNLPSASAKWGTRIGSFTFPGCPPTPDFTMSAVPAMQTACIPGDVEYSIQVGANAGFSDPVTLSVTGTPTGYGAAFSSNPVTPSATSVLTLTGSAVAAPGTYSLDVVGVSPTSTHTVTVGLDLVAGPPTLGTLLSPASGATGVLLTPDFAWTAAPTAVTYLLEVATDFGFSNVVYSATVSDANHTAATALAPGTEHFWRVTAENICGTGMPSAVSSFTTAVYICAVPNLAIPDNTPAGVTSTLSVSMSGTLFDLNVFLDVSHTWVGDLQVTLLHEVIVTPTMIIDRPGVPAMSSVGCGADDINTIVDDEGSDGSVETECDNGPGPALSGLLSPSPGALSDFDGEDVSGTWRLTISDHAGVDTGTLNRWCLLPLTADSLDSDLEMSKVIKPEVAMPGEPVTYTLVYTNHGPSAASNITITDIIPEQLTGVAFESSGAAITPTGGISLTWQVADLAPRTGGVITVTGIVSPLLSNDTIVSNTVTITGGLDNNVANNSGLAILDVNVPRVYFTGPSSTVPEAGGQVLITASLGVPNPYADILVDYAFVGGSATPGSDYVAADGTVTFTAGSIYASFAITIVDDSTAEPDKTLLIDLDNPVGAALSSPSRFTLVIWDEEAFRQYLPYIAND